MGGQRSPFYGPYSCTSHGSCLLTFGPLRANPLVCSFIASPIPSPSLRSCLFFLCLYVLPPASRPPQLTTIIHTLFFSRICYLPVFLFLAFVAVFLMGLKIRRRFPSSARAYIFILLAGLSLRVLMQWVDSEPIRRDDYPQTGVHRHQAGQRVARRPNGSRVIDFSLRRSAENGRL